jgi:hypothetical protein
MSDDESIVEVNGHDRFIGAFFNEQEAIAAINAAKKEIQNV